MLINFTVKNFLSIGEELTLSMNEYMENHRKHNSIIVPDDSNYTRRVSAIFGLNGSGKSNIVKALETMKNIITNPYFTTSEPISHWSGKYGNITQFKIMFSLNQDIYMYSTDVYPIDIDGNGKGPYMYSISKESLTTLVPDISGDYYSDIPIFNIEYDEFDNNFTNTSKMGKNVTKEFEIKDTGWHILKSKMAENARLRTHMKKLYRSIDKFETSIFDSSLDVEKKRVRQRKYDMRYKIAEIGSKIVKNSFLINSIHCESTKRLSVLYTGDPSSLKNIDPQEFNESCNRVFDWFCFGLTIIGTNDYVLPLETDRYIDYLSSILYSMDTGIEKILWKEVDIVKDLKEIERVKYYLAENETQRLINAKRISLRNGIGVSLVLKGDRDFFKFSYASGKESVSRLMALHSDEEIPFPLSEESDGTLRILEISVATLPDISDRTFIIDEIDRRLHTLVSKKMVNLFINKGNAYNQLIFTTHEMRLMSTEILCIQDLLGVKKVNSETILYPLKKLRAKNRSKRLDRLYLDSIKHT